MALGSGHGGHALGVTIATWVEEHMANGGPVCRDQLNDTGTAARFGLLYKVHNIASLHVDA